MNFFDKISTFLMVHAIAFFLIGGYAVVSLLGAPDTSWLFVKIGIVLLSCLLSLQGLLTIYWSLFAWEDPERRESSSLVPKKMLRARYSFSILVPARHEDKVIARTLQSLQDLQYPTSLIEVLVLCKQDDTATIQAARTAIKKMGAKHMRVVVFDSARTNKPTALNIGLSQATGNIIAVIDAEDDIQPDILHAINTAWIQEQPAAIQAGVQLINDATTWFSVRALLEYYFWFKSALHVFASLGVVPLGGNTVFFDRRELRAVGGWDETALTEDAEIGIRLSAAGKKIHVLYRPELATLEESPATTLAFVKQRSRWNQGFLQILQSGVWLKYPLIEQRVYALYLLLLPYLSALTFLSTLSLVVTFSLKMPPIVTIVAFFPLYLFVLQWVVQIFGFWEFCLDFRHTSSVKTWIWIVIGYIPYQFLLGVCAMRAVIRHLLRKQTWEKTAHENLHREVAAIV